MTDPISSFRTRHTADRRPETQRSARREGQLDGISRQVCRPSVHGRDRRFARSPESGHMQICPGAGPGPGSAPAACGQGAKPAQTRSHHTASGVSSRAGGARCCVAVEVSFRRWCSHSRQSSTSNRSCRSPSFGRGLRMSKSSLVQSFDLMPQTLLRGRSEPPNRPRHEQSAVNEPSRSRRPPRRSARS